MGYGIGGGGGNVSVYTPESIGGGGGDGEVDVSVEETPDIGKGSIDLTDPLGSVGETVGNVINFGSGLIGGVAGAIGQVGPDAETASLGQLAEDIGRIPGGIGDIQLPHLDLVEGDEERQAATLSQVPGAMYEPVYQAQQHFKRWLVHDRVERYTTGQFSREKPGSVPLPPDLLDRLEAGESVDAITDEILARGQAYGTDPGSNLVGDIVFDPLNLIAPGAGAALKGAKGAGYAVQGATDLAKLGMTERSIGTIYNAATKGMSQGGAAIMDKVVGPTTSGVFHALGSKPYRTLASKAGELSPDYEIAFKRAFDLGAGQLPRAVIAREVMEDVKVGLDKMVRDVSRKVENRLTAKSTRELERRSEELLARTTPDFYGSTPESMFAETASKYAAITGMSPEDAARVLGGKVNRQTARTVHLAYYGHAGGQLADIKNVLRGQPKLGIDVDRLTVLARDTLTDELAVEIGKSIPVADAVERFSQLTNHFLGKKASDDEVLEFVEKLRGSGALPQAVKLPKKGKLPPALSEWRTRNAEFGYELGFAPKDGWKAIVDADGNVIASDPFVHFVSDVDPTHIANPLGRFMDALMRGKTQTIIVQESRQRMTDFVAKAELPISPNQVRSIHAAILEAAADAKLSPRGLVGLHTEGGTVYEAIFKKFLSPAEYDALTAQFDPTFLVMKAFEGNWQTIGLTQKLTGAVKTAGTEGKVPGGANIAKIAEELYPKARFTYRPTFQAQEIIESPTFNFLRGVTDREVAPELADAYRALAEQPEFRFLTEANFLNIAGDRAVAKFMGKNTPLGRAMGRFTNIQARKETQRVRQVMFEHGEDFKNAVNNMNPKFWKAMEEAYGTTDASVIADNFLAERLALSGDEASAMAAVDAMKAEFDDSLAALQRTLEGEMIRAGDEVASQAANIRAGVAKGGTRGSGGAVLDEGALPSGPADMVWQAFRDSMRQASNRAFRTHFFAMERGWLERSLNHPYLGIYPLSYMWGKVLPEFARFLLVRPFGKNVPLLPIVELERVQQAYIGALADDPSFREYMEDHEESIYFANLLFPGNPVNLAANAPAYARHIVEDAQAGRKVDSTTVTREIADSTAYAFGPAHDLTSLTKAGADLADIGQNIFELLEQAAQQYDGQFPRR